MAQKLAYQMSLQRQSSHSRAHKQLTMQSMKVTMRRLKNKGPRKLN
jgi:hypothetical protein